MAPSSSVSRREDPADSPVLSHKPKTEILEALSRKRKELDEEIEIYKAKKDEEYKTYEHQILDHLEGHDPITHKSNGILVGDNGSNRHKHEDHPKPEDEGNVLMKEEGLANQNPETTSQECIKEQDRNAPVRKTAINFSEAEAQRVDRELELHGLFTPAFLPLLEDSNRHSRYNHKSIASTSSNHRSAASMPSSLSTSLTLPSTTYDPLNSPTEPEARLPSSAPRPSFSNRRSSSRSDTSPGASLRSSLRQPKSPQQTPRERKHVLFSIDNIVMSPSSSPVAHRSKQTSPGAAEEPIETPAINATPSLVKKDFTPPSSFSNLSIQMPQAPSSSKPPSPASSLRNYHQLIEPNVTTPVEELEKADFEPISMDDDPMFAFEDEHLPRDEIDDGFEDEVMQEMEVEDDSVNTQGPAHVGSLPIDIKLPSRMK